MSVEEIRAAYNDNAGLFHRLEPLERLLTGRMRRRLFGDVSGRVLDVACGTGANFRYLPASIELVGVDISPEMLAVAETRIDRFEAGAHLEPMDAQALAFDDDSFDAVVSALSTCTFPDPVTALGEMARVCRPGGQIRLLEHGRSSLGPIARYQDWRDAAHYRKFGCRWTQEPLGVVREAGLAVEDSRTWLFGIFTAIEARPEGSATS